MNPILTVQNLSKSFGGLKAVQEVQLQAFPGQILSVIGPNGAGKTTLFNCLSGFYRPDTGTVTLENEPIHELPPHEICRLGMTRTFQNIRLFDRLTVLDNVLVGHFNRESWNPFELLFHTAARLKKEKEARDESMEWLRFVGLENHAHEKSCNLSYGLQRRLEIARALATKPKVLLLDEPGAGMNPNEIGKMIELITKIRDKGLAVILIEHHMKVVMEISQTILVLDHGEELAIGTPAEIRSHPEVIAAYLGQPAKPS